MTSSPAKPASHANAAAVLTLARAVPIFAALMLGAFVVVGVGFSHIAAVHNAAHDYRHSMGFPCH